MCAANSTNHELTQMMSTIMCLTLAALTTLTSYWMNKHSACRRLTGCVYEAWQGCTTSNTFDHRANEMLRRMPHSKFHGDSADKASNTNDVLSHQYTIDNHILKSSILQAGACLLS